jgi:hypothetical protein
MRYYYKRPGDWMWTPLDTGSLSRAVESGVVQPNWQFRIEGESATCSLVELLERERRLQRHAPRSEAEAKLLAPDGTWGVMLALLGAAFLAFALLVPIHPATFPNSRFAFIGFGVTWLMAGVRLARVARAWKRRHAHHNEVYQRCSQPS